ncbi:hypothetical protein M9458_052920 [Cirrhinus mrigala]|uniref:DUF4939 domain-containing protein n=1 Tax=Cirrhinus mrigala TaxID=683832 RepID=A0ABD0MNX9_CIRMR
MFAIIILDPGLFIGLLIDLSTKLCLLAAYLDSSPVCLNTCLCLASAVLSCRHTTLYCLTILSCKWILFCCLSTKLSVQASQLAMHQHQLNRLTTLTEELVKALQGLCTSSPEAAAAQPLILSNLLPAQISPISPQLAFSEKFDGEPTKCKGFLLQCSLFVNQQPSPFPTDSSRIAFVCSLLTGRALDWATAVWRMEGSSLPTFDVFLQHFRNVFEHPAAGKGMGEWLLTLTQGRTPAGDYALSFRTLAAQTVWEEDTLQSELACRDKGKSLGEFMDLVIEVDNLIRSRRSTRATPRYTSETNTAAKPMQLEFTHLTPDER